MKEETIKYKTPLTYYGGKQQLLKTILPLIPTHRIYCEPFFGGGAVFFAKKPSYLEVINDVNDNLVNFYHECQEHFEQLCYLVQHTLDSESTYNWAKSVFNGTVEVGPLQKAYATWIVFNMSFNANPLGGWRWDNGTDNSHTGIVLYHFRKYFCPWIEKRLQKVQISCRDALRVISDRDTPGSFFYLDPPYPGAQQAHYSGYTEDDLQKLLDLLSVIHGQFLLSCYDLDIINDYAQKKNWQLLKFDMNSCIKNHNRHGRKTEILLMNYEKKDIIQTTLF